MQNDENLAVPSWGLGPFIRIDAANPILGPNAESAFDCPMTGRSVAWEKAHVFNPAAALRGGRICLIYRAEDGLGASGLGSHTSRLGLAESDDGVLLPDGRRPCCVRRTSRRRSTAGPAARKTRASSRLKTAAM